MSSQKPPKKKVVVTTSKPAPAKSGDTKAGTAGKNKAASPRRKAAQQPQAELIFSRKNYQLMIAGFVLVALGIILMWSNGMADPNEWDVNKVYGFRQTVLAPILILAGLSVEIVGIFKR